MAVDIRRPNFRFHSVGLRIPRRLYLFRVEWFRRRVLREITACFVWEPRHLWIGLYIAPPEFGHLILFLCLIPCLPLRLHFKVAHGAGGVA